MRTRPGIQIESHCRFLGSTGRSSPAPFLRLLDALDVRLPGSLRVEDAIELGWIRPKLTIQLPSSFFLEWKSFPSFPREDVSKENYWATHVWALLSDPTSPSPVPFRDPPQGFWYRHFLDTPTYWVTAQAMATGAWIEAEVPRPTELEHPRHPGRPVQPQIYFFRYWQAYELLERIYASRLAGPLWDTAEASEDLAAVSATLQERKDLASLRGQRIREYWSTLEDTFDWLSRFRTLCAICAHRALADPGRFRIELRDGAFSLKRQLSLTIAEIRRGIRDHLLGLWRRWELGGRESLRLSPTRALLQEDIDRALTLLKLVSHRSVRMDDPFWAAPSDRMPREWSPLTQALPFETETAKSELPERAMFYVETFNALVGKRIRISAKELRDRVATGWDESVALRRFVLAFWRLHAHYEGLRTSDTIVGLSAETPIDFLILAALHCERLLSEPYARSGVKLPPFAVLVQAALKKQLARAGVRNHAAVMKAFGDRYKKVTGLHDLPATRVDPFVHQLDSGVSGGATARVLVRTYLNFSILRNYSAHHDCLDDSLIGTSMAEAPMEALVVVAMGALRAI